MPLITPQVPENLVDLMKDLSKNVIKENPKDIIRFSADYFIKLLLKRDNELNKGYERFYQQTDPLVLSPFYLKKLSFKNGQTENILFVKNADSTNTTVTRRKNYSENEAAAIIQRMVRIYFQQNTSKLRKFGKKMVTNDENKKSVSSSLYVITEKDDILNRNTNDNLLSAKVENIEKNKTEEKENIAEKIFKQKGLLRKGFDDKSDSENNSQQKSVEEEQCMAKHVYSCIGNGDEANLNEIQRSTNNQETISSENIPKNFKSSSSNVTKKKFSSSKGNKESKINLKSKEKTVNEVHKAENLKKSKNVISETILNSNKITNTSIENLKYIDTKIISNGQQISPELVETKETKQKESSISESTKIITNKTAEKEITSEKPLQLKTSSDDVNFKKVISVDKQKANQKSDSRLEKEKTNNFENSEIDNNKDKKVFKSTDINQSKISKSEGNSQREKLDKKSSTEITKKTKDKPRSFSDSKSKQISVENDKKPQTTTSKDKNIQEIKSLSLENEKKSIKDQMKVEDKESSAPEFKRSVMLKNKDSSIEEYLETDSLKEMVQNNETFIGNISTKLKEVSESLADNAQEENNDSKDEIYDDRNLKPHVVHDNLISNITIQKDEISDENISKLPVSVENVEHSKQQEHDKELDVSNISISETSAKDENTDNVISQESEEKSVQTTESRASDKTVQDTEVESEENEQNPALVQSKEHEEIISAHKQIESNEKVLENSNSQVEEHLLEVSTIVLENDNQQQNQEISNSKYTTEDDNKNEPMRTTASSIDSIKQVTQITLPEKTEVNVQSVNFEDHSITTPVKEKEILQDQKSNNENKEKQISIPIEENNLNGNKLDSNTSQKVSNLPSNVIYHISNEEESNKIIKQLPTETTVTSHDKNDSINVVELKSDTTVKNLIKENINEEVTKLQNPVDKLSTITENVEISSVNAVADKTATTEMASSSSANMSESLRSECLVDSSTENQVTETTNLSTISEEERQDIGETENSSQLFSISIKKHQEKTADEIDEVETEQTFKYTDENLNNEKLKNTEKLNVHETIETMLKLSKEVVEGVKIGEIMEKQHESVDNTSTSEQNSNTKTDSVEDQVVKQIRTDKVVEQSSKTNEKEDLETKHNEATKIDAGLNLSDSVGSNTKLETGKQSSIEYDIKENNVKVEKGTADSENSQNGINSNEIAKLSEELNKSHQNRDTQHLVDEDIHIQKDFLAEEVIKNENGADEVKKLPQDAFEIELLADVSGSDTKIKDNLRKLVKTEQTDAQEISTNEKMIEQEISKIVNQENTKVAEQENQNMTKESEISSRNQTDLEISQDKECDDVSESKTEQYLLHQVDEKAVVFDTQDKNVENTILDTKNSTEVLQENTLNKPGETKKSSFDVEHETTTTSEEKILVQHQKHPEQIPSPSVSQTKQITLREENKTEIEKETKNSNAVKTHVELEKRLSILRAEYLLKELIETNNETDDKKVSAANISQEEKSLMESGGEKIESYQEFENKDLDGPKDASTGDKTKDIPNEISKLEHLPTEKITNIESNIDVENISKEESTKLKDSSKDGNNQGMNSKEEKIKLETPDSLKETKIKLETPDSSKELKNHSQNQEFKETLTMTETIEEPDNNNGVRHLDESGILSKNAEEKISETVKDSVLSQEHENKVFESKEELQNAKESNIDNLLNIKQKSDDTTKEASVDKELHKETPEFTIEVQKKNESETEQTDDVADLTETDNNLIEVKSTTTGEIGFKVDSEDKSYSITDTDSKSLETVINLSHDSGNLSNEIKYDMSPEAGTHGSISDFDISEELSQSPQDETNAAKISKKKEIIPQISVLRNEFTNLIEDEITNLIEDAVKITNNNVEQNSNDDKTINNSKKTDDDINHIDNEETNESEILEDKVVESVDKLHQNKNDDQLVQSNDKELPKPSQIPIRRSSTKYKSDDSELKNHSKSVEDEFSNNKKNEHFNTENVSNTVSEKIIELSKKNSFLIEKDSLELPNNNEKHSKVQKDEESDKENIGIEKSSQKEKLDHKKEHDQQKIFKGNQNKLIKASTEIQKEHLGGTPEFLKSKKTKRASSQTTKTDKTQKDKRPSITRTSSTSKLSKKKQVNSEAENKIEIPIQTFTILQDSSTEKSSIIEDTSDDKEERIIPITVLTENETSHTIEIPVQHYQILQDSSEYIEKSSATADTSDHSAKVVEKSKKKKRKSKDKYSNTSSPKSKDYNPNEDIFIHTCSLSKTSRKQIDDIERISDSTEDTENSNPPDDPLESMYYALKETEDMLMRMHRRASYERESAGKERKSIEEKLASWSLRSSSSSSSSSQSGSSSPRANQMTEEYEETTTVVEENYTTYTDRSSSETKTDSNETSNKKQKHYISGDEFKISTFVENFTSSDTDSTIVSAVTKIQSGVRGFLARQRLRRASTSDLHSSSTKTSKIFNQNETDNDTDIDTDMWGSSIDYDPTQRDTKYKASSLIIQRFENTSVWDKENDICEESEETQTEIKMETIKEVQNENSFASEKKDISTGSQLTSEESSEMSHPNQDRIKLAARRSTLQRSDAVQKYSNQDNENDTSGLESKPKSSGQTSIKKKNSINYLGLRQRSMPVQVDFNIVRVLPKQLSKKVKSTELSKSTRKRKSLE